MALTLSATPAFCMIIALGMLIGWLVVRPRYWRADPSTLDSSPPPLWYLGEEAWRGFLRSSAATVPLTVLIFICGSLVMVFGEDSATGGVFGSIGAILLIVVIVLATTVTRYNRPRWVVPPPLRSHPGTREQRRKRRYREQRRRRER